MNTPKIELHLHLDGSLYLPWAWQTAIKRGVVRPDCTFEQYYNIFHGVITGDRQAGFKKFDFPCAVMQTREDLSDSIYYLIRTLNELGLIYAEIRYASQQHTLGGLTQAETIDALIDGINRAKVDFPNIDIGLINCMMHKGENALTNWDANIETLEASAKYLGKGLVGVDLAGYENNGDFMLYAPLFEKARELGLPYTIHAGEMGDGSHVPMALAMGAYRIGHGINCVDNPEWLQAAVDSGVPFEVCVTSNCRHGVTYADHPVRKMIEAGIKVTLNSDNMSFSKTNQVNEHCQLRAIGVSEETLMQCTLNAVDAAFCSDEIKAKLRKKLGVE